MPTAKVTAEKTTRRKRAGGNAAKGQPSRGRKKLPPVQQLGGKQLEQPPPMHRRVAALIQAAYPGKRRASNAWDDRLPKHRHADPLVSLPWETEGETKYDSHGHKLEKPGYQVHNLFSDPLALNDRVKLGREVDAGRFNTMGAFANIPSELCSIILRGLLVHHTGIRVMKGWSLVFPRTRPNLEVGVLRVCRSFHRQGIRVLYGENMFVYLNRDQPSWREDTKFVEQQVFGRNHIPIDKYGHMVRHIKVVVEANRMHEFESRKILSLALEKFLPISGCLQTPAQLHTVTIELPAQTRAMMNMEMDNGTEPTDVPASFWFRRDSSVLEALKNLNCQFIYISAYTCQNEYFEVRIDRRSHFRPRNTDEGKLDIWANGDIMLAKRNEAAKSNASLEMLFCWIQQLAGQCT